MKIRMATLVEGLIYLVDVCWDPSFDYDNWVTAEPLIPKFQEVLQAIEQDQPGWLSGFKTTYQFALTMHSSKLESYLDNELEFAIPEPVQEFMIFLWKRLFPDEPWERSFPDDTQVDWRW